MQKIIFWLAFLYFFSATSTTVHARSINVTSFITNLRIMNRPQRKLCPLGELAKSQSSTVSFLDILLLFSPNNRKYSKCPTQNEMTGESVNSISARIFGGSVSRRGQWPWMAHLFEVDTCTSVCGGTLLNNYWVLTAAHCFDSFQPSLYGVVLGEYRISIPTPNEQFRLLEDIVRHSGFDPLSLNNDVALIKLAKPVHFTQHVRPACLPPSGYGTDRFEEPTLIGESSCTAMGWGRTGPNQPTADVLMDIPLNIIPDQLCYRQTIRSSHQRPPVHSFETKFCGGGDPSMDTCGGDSGGPVICALNGTYNVVGVTSYGPIPCGQQKQFGVYAKVADPQINDWIRKIISLPRQLSPFQT